jgi:hypothetical protein
MARFSRFVGLLSAATALFGCDEGPSSNLSFTTTPDVWSFVTGTAPGGPLLVDVRGDPFRTGRDAVAGDVVSAVAATFTEPWLRFTANDAEAGSKDLRLIWLLDPQSGFDADRVCAGERPALDAGRRVMEIRAVLCHRGRPLSAVHGWTRRPETAGERKWRGLISQMARQLLSGRG